MITHYGYDNFFALLGIGILLIAGGYFLSINWISVLCYSLGGILICFALWFFRDPLRTVSPEALANDSLIIAPADGKVLQVITIDEQKYLKSKARQISIFLSPLDVHVNRSPANGVVKFYHYYPGEYLMAFHPKSSELNEHSFIGLENKAGRIAFKQITGFLARRIVCELKEGDTVRAGDQFGMMKFGSRMDIMLPESAEILVKEGQRVVGGETIIAHLK